MRDYMIKSSQLIRVSDKLSIFKGTSSDLHVFSSTDRPSGPESTASSTFCAENLNVEYVSGLFFRDGPINVK